jgi:hypothetical protein
MNTYRVHAIEGRDNFSTTIIVYADTPADAKTEAHQYIQRNMTYQLKGPIQIGEVEQVWLSDTAFRV